MKQDQTLVGITSELLRTVSAQTEAIRFLANALVELKAKVEALEVGDKLMAENHNTQMNTLTDAFDKLATHLASTDRCVNELLSINNQGKEATE